MNLNLYDNDLNRIAIIGSQYISCLWSEGYNTIENFTMELVATDEYKKKIRPDCYVGRNDRKTLMVIKTVKIANGKIVASGKQAGRVLDDVSFVGTIESGSMIDTSIKNAYNNGNKYRNLEFADTNLQIPYNHQISNKSILELCEITCQSEDIGFRTVRNNGVVTAEFYQPKENPNLVFSEKFGNLTIDSILISSENYKNYAVVLGEGEGNDRIRVDVDFRNNEKSDTLTFNPSSAEELEGMVQAGEGLYKVSDSIPTESDFANGCSLVYSGEVYSFTKEELYFLEDGFIPIDVVFIVPYDNYNADGLIFPEAGVYFVGGYVTSLTIPGYTGFGKNKEYRKDLIVDAKDLQIEENETNESYKKRLVARGIEKLLENQQTFSCAFSPYAKDFGVKYDLGDILTVYLTDYGLTLQSRVSRFTQKSQNNKIETTIEVGQITIKR